MTTEEKQLLLEDLCSRLLYGMKCRFLSIDGSEFHNVTAIGIKYLEFKNIYELNVKDENGFPYSCDIEYIKPYLRPMSSMSVEERREYEKTFEMFDLLYLKTWKTYDWLNKHFFDYRGLITMGLAIEAPEGMFVK